MIKRLMAGVLLASLAITAIAPVSASASGGKDIVERAIQVNKVTHQFDTLLAAATCDYFGGAIADALATTPGITLLAPTDRAFKELGLDKRNVCDTFAADPDALSDILTYHVIPDVVTYREAVKAIGTSITMLNGEKAAVTGRWWNVKIDGARVVLPNVPASNGLIHVVNAVLIP
jgi:uncharacterized surface protein with fasciclin (FAS1) repeats